MLIASSHPITEWYDAQIQLERSKNKLNCKYE
uniref:Uncharacterized protein n=1 Tax=Rhizophora mucronata TaxID=61149 RepID=A0A2P2QV02_RHIMU